jgi:acetylornithine/N-succinyldiaminopimelate aminotransferase
VQGEGGVTAMTNEFMQGLRKLCDEQRHAAHPRRGAVRLWPDRPLLRPSSGAASRPTSCRGQGIGGGFPLGACLAKGEVAAKSMVPGTHGSTYGGNPLASAVGNAVLDRILAPGFIDHVNQMGQKLAWHLQQLAQKYPNTCSNCAARACSPASRLPRRCATSSPGCVTITSMLAIGAGDNVLRLLPPLIVTEADIEEAVAKIGAAFDAIEAETASVPGLAEAEIERPILWSATTRSSSLRP